MFPEQKHFRSPRDYRKALRRAFEPHNGLFYTLICVMTPAGIVLVVCAEYLYRSVPDFFGSTWTHISLISVGFLVMALVLILLPYVIVTCVHRKRIRRSLRQQLREQGMPICPDCAYDMTGNGGGRCPECGATCSAIDPDIETGGPTLAHEEEEERRDMQSTTKRAQGDQTPRWVLVLLLLLQSLMIGVVAYRWAVPVEPSPMSPLLLVVMLCVGASAFCKLLRELLSKQPQREQNQRDEDCSADSGDS